LATVTVDDTRAGGKLTVVLELSVFLSQFDIEAKSSSEGVETTKL
jgi:hypothetical protein